ncbi:hypothetical protein F5X68DRAFT_171750 [Plectosphaerella plurivora]|uniref:Uncharacterized protein n=1 Tax=Plectosphaerella plurivora TaxID=936078 RepID=A0A9P9A910_9PEZI|nr:hypothetical protein F5X68DRAFT_171750 [Plectosphaerella plurivora]
MDHDRARANVPRQGQRQTLAGLDSYHQYIIQSNRNQPRPRVLSNDRMQRPYAPGPKSFSKPRPSHTPSLSATSQTRLRPPDDRTPNPPRPTTRGQPINPRASAVRYSSPEPPPATPESADLADVTKSDKLLQVALPWRPYYLRRRIILLFFLLFASLAAAVEILLEVSKRRSGIAWPDKGARYPWQFLAPAVVLLVAVMWSRVEYQAKSTAPWLRMAKGPASLERTLILDYTSMLQPLAIRTALRNRDWLVVVVSIVSIILKIVLVASVALIIPTFADVTDDTAILHVTDAFTDNVPSLREGGVLAVNSIVGIQTQSINLPDGVSRENAFQSFQSDLAPSAELRATVDGFRGELGCDRADVSLTSVQLLRGNTIQLNLRVTSGSCVTNHLFSSELLDSPENARVPRIFMRFRDAGCNDSPATADQRVVVFVGTLTLDASTIPTNPNVQNAQLAGQIPQSGAVVCRPLYTVAPYEVTKNSTQLLSSSRITDRPGRSLQAVDPWDIAEAHFDAYSAVPNIVGLPSASTLYPGLAVVESDSIMDAVIATEVLERGVPQLGSLLEPTALGQLATSYWSRYTAFLAKESLVIPVRQNIIGRTVLAGQRLVVKAVPAHFMTAFLGLATILALFADYLTPKEGFLPRRPSTIIGMATLLAHSRPLLQCLRGAGAADEETIRQRLRGSRYYVGVEAYEKTSYPGVGYFKILGGHPPPQNAPIEFSHTGKWKRPVPLRLWARIALIMVAFAMVIGLEVVLRFSIQRNGFTAVRGDEYIYLVWTTLTVVLLGALALYTSKADFETRVLAPYAKLRFGGSLGSSAALDFLDKSQLPVLWSALRTGNLSVLVTVVTAFLAGVLAVFAGTLFTAVPAQSSRSVVLQSTDFFADTIAPPATILGIPTVLDRDVAISSLILHANLSFPDFTFDDLTIPAMQLEAPIPQGDLDLGVVRVATVLRVLRPNLDCRLYPRSEIVTNLTFNYQIGNIPDPLRIDVTSEPCRTPGSEIFGSNAIISTANSRMPNASGLFGRATSKVINPSQCSDFFYTWGRVVNGSAGTPQVSFVSAMGCNETAQTVTANVIFQGPDLQIDPALPPTVQEMTAVTNRVVLAPLQYDALADTSTPGNMLDPFFSSLTTSRFAIPATDLGDDSLEAAGRVADAAVSQHKLIRTQSINLRSRQTLTPQGTFPSVSSGVQVGSGLDPGTDAATVQPRLLATLTSASSTAGRRLLVDEVTVRILQALLSVIVLGGVASLTLALIGSGGVVGVGMLPRHPGSIASAAALLADGNLFGYLPRGAEWMSCDQLEADIRSRGELGDVTMGWETVRRRRRDDASRLGLPPEPTRRAEEEFGIRVVREGGWQGGSEVGLGQQARVGISQQRYAS